MNRSGGQVGFSQRVRIEWLDYTANLVLAGHTKSEINDALQLMLKDKVSVGGQAERGNREKIITILMKVWLNVPSRLEPLRTTGLELLSVGTSDDQMAVHWGMIAAVYPFWLAIATQVGRLLRIQGSAAAVQIQRRIREQYGERETVSRAARRVLRSFLDWGVLQETDKKGIYGPGDRIQIDSQRLLGWLVEALLNARGGGPAPLKDLLNGPDMFPFGVRSMRSDILSKSSGIEILRHGLDEELIVLRK